MLTTQLLPNHQLPNLYWEGKQHVFIGNPSFIPMRENQILYTYYLTYRISPHYYDLIFNAHCHTFYQAFL